MKDLDLTISEMCQLRYITSVTLRPLRLSHQRDFSPLERRCDSNQGISSTVWTCWDFFLEEPFPTWVEWRRSDCGIRSIGLMQHRSVDTLARTCHNLIKKTFADNVVSACHADRLTNTSGVKWSMLQGWWTPTWGSLSARTAPTHVSFNKALQSLQSLPNYYSPKGAVSALNWKLNRLMIIIFSLAG